MKVISRLNSEKKYNIIANNLNPDNFSEDHEDLSGEEGKGFHQGIRVMETILGKM